MKKNTFNNFVSSVFIPTFFIYCLFFYNNKNNNINNNQIATNKTTDQKEIINKITETKGEENQQDEKQVVEEITFDEIEIPNNLEENKNNDVINIVEQQNNLSISDNNTNLFDENNNLLANETLNIINNIRTSNGLNQLVMDNTLIQIAGIRAKEITTNWSHTRPNGSEWWTLYSEFGIKGAYGENLAYGQDTASEVVNDWMNSEGHKENILSDKFNKIGIFIYNYNGINYWVQEFLN